MAIMERVTVTLPKELIESIDHFEGNRSRFIAEAVGHEIARRRHAELLRSLETPHPEAAELADAGLAEWAETLPDEGERLVNTDAGVAVRWVEGRGWLEKSE